MRGDPVAEGAAPWALTGNAADPEQVAEASKKERFNERTLGDCWARLMVSPDALIVFGDFFERYHAFSTPFNPNPTVMAFQTGQQDTVHYLMAQINKARPEALSKMIANNKKEKL